MRFVRRGKTGTLGVKTVITFTPDAYTELCRRVDEHDEPNAGVAVGWLPARRDLIRTPDGKAVWTQPEQDTWAVVVMALSELPASQKISKVGDLSVYFHPEGSGIDQVTVTFEGGEFHVRPIDA